MFKTCFVKAASLIVTSRNLCVTTRRACLLDVLGPTAKGNERTAATREGGRRNDGEAKDQASSIRSMRPVITRVIRPGRCVRIHGKLSSALCLSLLIPPFIPLLRPSCVPDSGCLVSFAF